MSALDILLYAVIVGLATYRLAILFYWDDGPLHVFLRLRQYLGARAAGSNGGFWYWVAEIVNCPYCLGVWFAALLAMLVSYRPIEFVLIWLAGAGLQAFMQTCTKKELEF